MGIHPRIKEQLRIKNWRLNSKSCKNKLEVPTTNELATSMAAHGSETWSLELRHLASQQKYLDQVAHSTHLWIRKRTISMKCTSVKSTRDLKKRDLTHLRWNWMLIYWSQIYLASRNSWMTKPKAFTHSIKSLTRLKNHLAVNQSRPKPSSYRIAIFTRESYWVAWWVKSWHPASTRLFRANTSKKMQILNMLRTFKDRCSSISVSGFNSHKKKWKRLDVKK